MKLLVGRFVFTFLVSFVLALFANGQSCPPLSSGCLDPTFGTGGKATYLIDSAIPVYPEGMAVQTDGKIVAAVGYDKEQLARLNSDGSLDTTFGTGGIVRYSWSIGSAYGNVQALALQNIAGQERIVVAGYGPLRSGRDFISVLYLERFMPDGSVDVSFGTNGIAVINTGYASAIAIQPDGKILTDGIDSGQLVRLTASGSLDNTFGNGGVVNSGPSRAIAIDSTGGILIGGSVTVGKGNNARNNMSVKRYTSSGVLDTSFGASGTATADFGVSAQTWNLAIDVLGNIVVSGTATGPAVARFTSNGLTDTSFGGGSGKALYSGLPGAGRGLVIQPDNKIVVTGHSNNDFGLARFNYNGSVDTGFGNCGSVTTDVYGSDFSNVSVLQIDPACSCPKIVMSGGASPYTSFARYIIQ